MTVTFEEVSAKLGAVAGATEAVALEVFNAAAEAGHEVWFLWGMGPGNEHGSGRALDFMVRDHAGGTFVRDYLWAHRARLRVHHVIWDQHITSTYVSPGVVRAMADRGSVTQNHKDHVHAWFDEGAYVAPRTPTAPSRSERPAVPPYPGKQLRRGAKGPAVRAVQQRLKDRGWSIKVDGSFGPATERVVRQFQENKHLRVDGIVGRATHAALWLLPVT